LTTKESIVSNNIFSGPSYIAHENGYYINIFL